MARSLCGGLVFPWGGLSVGVWFFCREVVVLPWGDLSMGVCVVVFLWEFGLSVGCFFVMVWSFYGMGFLWNKLSMGWSLCVVSWSLCGGLVYVGLNGLVFL